MFLDMMKQMNTWSFGDEGTSTDPFPTWTYETNGPYQLCLTVSNEENDCSETYCETIEVDSLGWIFGIQDEVYNYDYEWRLGFGQMILEISTIIQL